MYVTEKVLCQKIDKYYFKMIRDVFANILNSVCGRTVKQNLLTIMKI